MAIAPTVCVTWNFAVPARKKHFQQGRCSCKHFSGKQHGWRGARDETRRPQHARVRVQACFWGHWQNTLLRRWLQRGDELVDQRSRPMWSDNWSARYGRNGLRFRQNVSFHSNLGKHRRWHAEGGGTACLRWMQNKNATAAELKTAKELIAKLNAKVASFEKQIAELKTAKQANLPIEYVKLQEFLVKSK